MAARSIGNGTLSFGMVSIPIRMYSAGESSSAVSFNMLHDKCKSRLKQQYICPKDNEIVTREHTVKGYEFAKDQYVSFTPDELKAMDEEAQKAIEITEFVPSTKVDPVYFDGAYYLGPDKGGEKAYKLINEAMKQTGRAALAKWAARGKQYLVMIRPVGNGLVMQQLLYKDEVRPISEVPIGDAELKDSELKLAVRSEISFFPTPSFRVFHRALRWRGIRRPAFLERGDLVAEVGGAFEFQARRGLAHLLFQLGDDADLVVGRLVLGHERDVEVVSFLALPRVHL